MTETLENLAQDIRETLSAEPGTSGLHKVCQRLSQALSDREFLTAMLPERAPGAHPREVLYEDPDLGFCICGHVYDSAALGFPHDHGPSWAIYGQADGITEMTEWTIVEKGSGDKPSFVVPNQTYNMEPGDARLYDVGVVHSPKRERPVKLIRIEGTNLDHIERSNIKAKQ